MKVIDSIKVDNEIIANISDKEARGKIINAESNVKNLSNQVDDFIDHFVPKDKNKEKFDSDGQYITVEDAIKDLDRDWYSKDIWETMSRCTKVTNAYPEAFLKYVSKILCVATEDSIKGVRVIGIAHDKKVNNDNGRNAAFTLDYIEPIFTTAQSWNDSDTNHNFGIDGENEGAPSMPLWYTLNNTFYNSITNDIRRFIVPVYKTCYNPYTKENNIINCNIFIPSETEIFGTCDYCNEGNQYDHWVSYGADVRSYKKYYSTNTQLTARAWWLRTPYEETGFGCVGTDGILTNATASTGEFVFPTFCVG